jgi:dihydroorotate dehydrogenase (NAD+) catalytic subunit
VSSESARISKSAPKADGLSRRSSGSSEVDLRVQVGTLSLRNPIVAASGTFGYGIEFAHLVDLNALGGIVVKGLSIQPRAGNPSPRMCETPGGMVNSIGLQNIGVRAFVADKLPLLRQFKVPILANIFGQTTSEYVEVIRILEDAEGLSAYELNISCPNVDHGGAEYSTDPSLTAEVVSAARKAAKRPLWVKLSPAIGIIRLTAKASEDAGADALVVANTYPALCLDAHNRRSRLGSTTGGLSGPAVKPITVRLVHELSRVVRLPIIGLGGIENPTDVAEYILAGASAVQVGTAHFVDPRASQFLVEGLEKWCRDENLPRISDLRGAWEAGTGCQANPKSDIIC